MNIISYTTDINGLYVAHIFPTHEWNHEQILQALCFVKHRQEVLAVLILTRRRRQAGLSVMGTDECVPVFPHPDSLLWRGRHAGGFSRAHVDQQQTDEPAGHGSAAGVWKMGAVKWKTAEERTVWMKGTKVSYSGRRRTRTLTKVVFFHSLSVR